MISHVRIEPRTDLGSPTPILSGVRVGPAVSRGRGEAFIRVLYVGYIALAHVQQDDGGDSAL